MTDKAYGAVILAAGYSSRMQGRIKALLPVGGYPAVVRLIRVFQKAGVDRIAVVLGHYESEIRDALEQEAVVPVWNPGYTKGMFSSVQTGVKAISEQKLHGFFLLPTDSMLTQTGIIADMMQAAPRNDDRFVVYPTCSGMRGHPPLIASGLIPDILSHTGEGGLQNLLQILSPHETDFETSSGTVLMDIDTTEEYENMLDYIRNHPEVADV